MADRPILFSAPMVRALLAGTKTQTRRIINPQPVVNEAGLLRWDIPKLSVQADAKSLAWHMRIGKGDRLYVRETWTHTGTGVWSIADTHRALDGGPAYQADGALPGAKYWPSIHMPRRFSRLTLHVTDVRVERLQDISREDALAEGIAEGADGYFRGAPDHLGQASPQAAYGDLWEAINGAGSWDANPWVAAYTFEVERCNIAQARAT